MTGRSKVLIGITSKNREQILRKAIASALEQTYIDKEVWVFDDASTDNTRLLVDKYPQVKWTISEEPKGLVYARNMFMANPQFDFFCSLDDDAWFIKDTAIAEAVEVLQKDPSIGALGFDMLSPDNPNITEKNVYLENTNNFIGCGHIINLSAAKKVNYYIPNPGFYGAEERDLCIRLIDKGYKVVTFKGMYVWHDKTSIARDLSKQNRSGVCNDLVFYYRRSPALLLWPVIGVQILKHFRFALTFKGHNFLKSTSSGVKDFFAFLKTKTSRAPVSTAGFKKFIKMKPERLQG